jgi:hypothetical protein
MTLDEFIADVKAGKVAIEMGGMNADGECETRVVALGLNAIAVTIDAYNAGAIPPATEWDDALEQVRGHLK